MADGQFTEDQFQNWMPASEAYRLVGAELGPQAAREILKRLAHGLLIGRAEEAFQMTGGKKTQFDRLAIIKDFIWEELAGEDYLHNLPIWSANSAEVEFPYKYPSRPLSVVFHLFGVRFDPAGIEKMLPKRVIQIPPEPPKTDWGKTAWPVPAASAPEPEQKGPPPSAKALAAWFDAYKAAYTGADDTEAKALESAKGCFPGKSVTREAVRALRGEQKRGRKSDSAI